MSELTTQHQHSFSIGDAISTGWNFTKKYFWVVIVLLLISVAPSIVEGLLTVLFKQIPGATQIIADPMTDMPSVQFVGVWAIITNVVSIILGVIGAWLGLGLIK